MPNKFGGYDYDAHCILTDSPEGRNAKLRGGDRIGEHGGYTGGGLQAAGRMTVGGIIREPASGTPNIRQLWRSFEAAHMPGTPQPLRLDYVGEGFAWAEAEGVADIHGGPTPFVGARQFEITFYLADPFLYENQEQGAQSLTVGASTNINNGGSRYASPVINFNVTHPGTVTVTSDAGQMEVYANLTGTYSIDSFNRFVTRNASSYYYRWDGVMPSLKPGQTTLALTVTHGTVSAATARWFNRD
jgi:hypothetical protein